MNTLPELFAYFGLGPKEVAVYESILATGAATVTQLIERTQLKRGDLYNVVDDLIKKELVFEYTNERGTRTFDLADPEVIRNLISQQRQRLVSMEDLSEVLLNEITTKLSKKSNRPSIRLEYGLTGIESVYSSILSSGTKELRLIRSVHDDEDPELNAIVKRQIKNQITRGIHTKALTPLAWNVPGNFLTHDQQNLVTRKLITEDLLKPETQILLWEHSVAFSALSKPYVTTVITHPTTAQTMNQLFDLIWLLAPENQLPG
jgi:sugar-specific transcriptional regulator TrmB